MVIKFQLDEETNITWPDGRKIKVNKHEWRFQIHFYMKESFKTIINVPPFEI